MNVFSKLTGNNDFQRRVAQFSSSYSNHRPLIQRCLNSAFVFYVLFSTYRGLSVKPSGPAKGKKGKGATKKGDDKASGKPARVAVCLSLISWC